MIGLTEVQSHRILERIQQRALLVDIIRRSTDLLKEMEDNDFKDISGMLTGNKKEV